MKIIEIEDDLYKYILSNIEAFGETPSEILRRLLYLAPQINETFNGDKSAPLKNVSEQVNKQKEHNVTIKAEDVINRPVKLGDEEKHSSSKKIKVVKKKAAKKRVRNSSQILQQTSVPEVLTKGVESLYASHALNKEPVIMSKFKMMLITMYYEDQDAFMSAIKKARGASRAYIGIELDQLLSSSNQKEVDILVASKPCEIPYTPLWVVTNTNTGRKRIILTQMMEAIGYPNNLIERIKDEI